MKKSLTGKCRFPLFLIISLAITSCANPRNNIIKQMKQNDSIGSYTYDLAFFRKHNIKTVELKDSVSNASVLIVPDYQGRVMTSSAKGEMGSSFGWINYTLIASGKKSNQFNPYGGEERIWLGPEGGPYSVYFKKGSDQVFANWVVPKELDTEPFDIVSQTETSIAFHKVITLNNASGTIMHAGIDRKIKLLKHEEVERSLNMKLDSSLSYVAYESENTLTNTGKSDWNSKSGFLSIWMLAMFNPSEKGVVFIPFKNGNANELGKIVTDDYFGKVPADRLLVKDKTLFFKTDGKHRSKIGISPSRALPMCGSYDPLNHSLTLLWYSLPEKTSKYVNSKWGNQDDPLNGDVVNSYNDGPVADGSIMGPFYEIESSSPAALLLSGEKITHVQRIFHLTGDEAKLSAITEKLFNISVTEINQAFSQK